MSSASDWKIYRTRFLIKARQLDAPLGFTDPLGREHHGRKGDYLVESSDGLQRIAPREIFEDIYVPMGLAQDPQPSSSQLEMSAQVSAARSALIQASALHPTATPPAFRTDTVAAADSFLPVSGIDRRTRRRDSMRSTPASVIASARSVRLDRATRSNPGPRPGARVSASPSPAQSPAVSSQAAIAATRTRRFPALSPRKPSTDFVRNFRGEPA